MNESSHLKFRGVPTVTLFVGEEEMPFYVHLDVICNQSSVFKAAFFGKFTEASNQSMDLPDHEIESVEQMIQWFYSKQYELAKLSSEKCRLIPNTRFWQLAKLNTLADKYNIIGLSDNIIDQFYDLHLKNCIPNLALAAYVYDNTTENSSFRKLLVAWYASVIDIKWYQKAEIREWLRGVPELAVDIIIALSIKASDPAQKGPFEYDKSKYYHQSKEDPTRNSK